MPQPQHRSGRGFTLVELLVVITIIALISAVALPVVLPALNERRVSEAARVFQSVLVGARDAAIRANAPRGIRLIPDPILSPAPFGTLGRADVLASNRFVAIEPAPDYKEGMVVPVTTATGGGFLHLIQANFTTVGSVPVGTEPTGWSYNIRQGDKIRLNDSGAYYTVAGPMQRGPLVKSGTVVTSYNTERYINDDRSPTVLATTGSVALDRVDGKFGVPAGVVFDPSDPMPTPSLDLRYGVSPPNATQTGPVAYLNLVNGVDDDGDGWIDEGFDGIDNDGDGITDPGYNGVDDGGLKDVIDDPAELLIGNEFEQEVFVGSVGSQLPADAYPLGSPPITPSAYVIVRRPIISPGARETTLPDGVVIDLTTWNSASATPASFINTVDNTGFPNGKPIQFPERSRVPVDPFTLFVDIMVAPSGQIVQSGAGSSGNSNTNASPSSNLPFYHFWLTDRAAVVPPLWAPAADGNTIGTPYQANRNPNYASGQIYQLPMPQGTPGYSPMPDDPNNALATYSTRPVFLTGERRLVTLFSRTGQVVTNAVENFNANDINAPYYDAQSGNKEPQ